jgi:hypothetical protein
VYCWYFAAPPGSPLELSLFPGSVRGSNVTVGHEFQNLAVVALKIKTVLLRACSQFSKVMTDILQSFCGCAVKPKNRFKSACPELLGYDNRLERRAWPALSYACA